MAAAAKRFIFGSALTWRFSRAMLAARGASCRSGPRVEARRLHSTPRPSLAHRAAPSANLAPRNVPALRSRSARIEVSSHARLPLMRTARSVALALQPRLQRCSFATEPTPAPEGKPASQPEAKPAPEAVKPVVDGAAAEGASVLKAQASEDPSAKADTGANKDGAETAKPAPAPASPASGVWATIMENRGIIWMVLFLNFIIWLNSFMLGTAPTPNLLHRYVPLTHLYLFHADTAEAKIAESLDFALSDDERLFAWNSLKMLSQFQPPHADKRYIQNVRQVIFDGVADDVRTQLVECCIVL